MTDKRPAPNFFVQEYRDARGAIIEEWSQFCHRIKQLQSEQRSQWRVFAECLYFTVDMAILLITILLVACIMIMICGTIILVGMAILIASYEVILFLVPIILPCALMLYFIAR